MSVGAPMISDVAFRLSQAGDMIGIDFECTDGRTRSVALPVSSLPKLIAGMMAAGAESAERRPPPPIPLAERELLHDGARAITDWRVLPGAGGEVVLEAECGVGRVCLRLPLVAARLMGLALQEASGGLQ